MIISKALGVYLATLVYNLPVFLDTQRETIFSVQIFFLDTESTILANSFSNLFMLFIFTIATIYLITRFWLSANSKYNPKILIKLNNLNLLSWIHHKENTFLTVLIWLIFLWLITLLIISDMFKHMTYNWIAVLSFTISIISSWILVRALEMELDTMPIEDNNSKIF